MNREMKLALHQIWGMSNEVKRIQRCALRKKKIADAARKRAIYLTAILMIMTSGKCRNVWMLVCILNLIEKKTK